MSEAIKIIYNMVKIYKIFIIYIFLLFVSFLLLFAIEIWIMAYVIWIILGFGWSLFFWEKRLNILEHLMVSPILAFVLFIVFISLLSLLGVSLTTLLFYIFVIASVVIFFLKKVFKPRNFIIKVEKTDLLLLSLIGVALVAKIYSIVELNTPNPSDEITHSFYAKSIIDFGAIRFFYSPGIHIFSAFTTMISGLSVVKQVMFLTNFFSAYSGVPVYLFVKKVFRDPIGALISALLFSLGIGITFFFYSAGKNAFIVAISVLFFFFFIISYDYKSNSVARKVLSIIALFATFIVHYPVAVFACIYWGSALITDLKNWKKYLQIFIGGVLGMGSLINAYMSYRIVDSISSTYNPYIIPPNLFEAFASYLVSIQSALFNFTFRGYPSYLVYVLLGSLFVVLIKTYLTKFNRSYVSFVVWTITSLLFCSVIFMFSIHSITIVLETYYLLLFAFSYIIISLAISTVLTTAVKPFPFSTVFYVFSIFFVLSYTLIGRDVYESFQAKKMSTIVKDTDMAMYSWIEENIQNDSIGILTNGYNYTVLVLPSDSGGWITLFAGNKISTPFWEFVSDATLANFNNYNLLKENPRNCTALDYFTKSGFLYYFQGSTPHYPNSLGTREELEANDWELIHSEGNVLLYKIPNCE